MIFCSGTGANRKSTFISATTGCIGDYHRVAPLETFTAANNDRHPTELAGLRGARLVTSVETEEGRRWAESKVKSLTGGDKIAARFMRQDVFDYLPAFKLLIAGNHKPGLRTVDEAIRRRLHLLLFTSSIPPEIRDEKLVEKLQAEWPGILAWAIRGCLDWQRQGLDPPPVVKAATTEYLEAEDALSAWIKTDPTEGVRNPQKRKGPGFRMWTEEDMAAYEQRWAVGTRQRVWLDVLASTGLRRGDAVRLWRAHVRDRMASIKTEKSGFTVAVTLPILPRWPRRSTPDRAAISPSSPAKAAARSRRSLSATNSARPVAMPAYRARLTACAKSRRRVQPRTARPLPSLKRSLGGVAAAWPRTARERPIAYGSPKKRCTSLRTISENLFPHI